MRRFVLIAVFLLSLLVSIVAFFQPYGPGQVWDWERAATDVVEGRVEKFEEGPTYSKVFLAGGETYYVRTPDSVEGALLARDIQPPPIVKVAEGGRLQLVIAVASFVVLLVSAALLVRSWLKESRAKAASG